MGKPVKLFRAAPPRDLVNRILEHLGLRGLHDLRWFCREELRLETLEEWLPEVEAYYLPCKASRFLHNWSEGSIITVIRHILHAHDYTLATEERLYQGAKTTLYQIQPVRSVVNLTEESLMVEFL
jgi:hypothetical protein